MVTIFNDYDYSNGISSDNNKNNLNTGTITNTEITQFNKT